MRESLEWEAYEHDWFPKTTHWFWIIGGATAVLMLVAILFNNFLFAILLLVGGFALALHGAKIPELVHYSLTPKGIRLNDQLFPYDRLRSFWITNEHVGHKVIIQIDRLLLPHLVLPMTEDVNGEHLREYLLQYLAEERHEESLADMLFDYLGF